MTKIQHKDQINQVNFSDRIETKSERKNRRRKQSKINFTKRADICVKQSEDSVILFGVDCTRMEDICTKSNIEVFFASIIDNSPMEERVEGLKQEKL